MNYNYTKYKYHFDILQIAKCWHPTVMCSRDLKNQEACEYTANTGDEIITKELSFIHVQQDTTNNNLHMPGWSPQQCESNTKYHLRVYGETFTV